ncbi:MAG TPA: YncE family protein [Micromonosporaceae bacterium]|nr:YncE family protein [Micromonosporaceae bacterium]
MSPKHAARRRRFPTRTLAVLFVGGAVTAALVLPANHRDLSAPSAIQSEPAAPSATPTRLAPDVSSTPLPGMPAPLDPVDIYAADRPNMLSPVVRGDRRLVYVPNNGSNTVSVIDPATYRVLRTVKVPASPQHVVPSWDLRTLWVNSDQGNALTPIDPRTGTFGKPVYVHDPYNLYFTPDGRYAVVMAEADHQIVFRDPHTMAIRHTLAVPCSGVNHTDFSADGRYMIVSCEFSGDLLKIDVEKQRIIAELHLPDHGGMPMPQDVKVSPDGRTWYVADMDSAGVWVLDGDTFTTPHLLHTGLGAHGLYVSRDSRYLYVTNRGEGSISVVSFADQKVVATWRIPGGGSPDMGGISADGTTLWLSGRYNRVVYAISTANGRLIRKIAVGTQPHGLCVWPQPGRYSLGHTGILR